jgi:hypothetical protein
MFKWFASLFRGRKGMSEQKLTDITRGMQHAASTTIALVADQYIRLLEQFFDPTEDGTLKAKMVRVAIDDKRYVLIPLVSLLTPRGLTLDQMRVQLSVRLRDMDVLKATTQEESEVTRASFNVDLAPRSEKGERKGDVVDIEMVFHAVDPPESVMRVIDMYANLIEPLKFPDAPAGLAPMEYAKSERYQEMLRKYDERMARKPQDDQADSAKGGDSAEADPTGDGQQPSE